MAERHDKLVSAFRAYLSNENYRIIKNNPFVDYRPDILAQRNKELIVAEIEIEQTLASDHTLGQLTKMYKYLKKNKKYSGFLIVPKQSVQQAILLIDSLFGDNKIKVQSL